MYGVTTEIFHGFQNVTFDIVLLLRCCVALLLIYYYYYYYICYHLYARYLPLYT